MSAERVISGRDNSDIVGTVHYFGEHGPAYEVIGIEGDELAVIRVVESGETLTYPVEDVRGDPDA